MKIKRMSSLGRGKTVMIIEYESGNTEDDALVDAINEKIDAGKIRLKEWDKEADEFLKYITSDPD